MRHNNIRDQLQREVCRDVVTEPALIPLDNEEIVGTNADRAAPDVSSRGLWSTFERTFFDISVTHPNSPTYDKKDMEQIYKAHETRKMKKYNNRIIEVEKGTFTPLIYSTNGGWGPQDTTRDLLKNYPRREEKTMRLLCVTCAPGLDSQSSGAP